MSHERKMSEVYGTEDDDATCRDRNKTVEQKGQWEREMEKVRERLGAMSTFSNIRNTRVKKDATKVAYGFLHDALVWPERPIGPEPFGFRQIPKRFNRLRFEKDSIFDVDYNSHTPMTPTV